MDAIGVRINSELNYTTDNRGCGCVVNHEEKYSFTVCLHKGNKNRTISHIKT
jgi:hypothetical protein